MLTKHQQTFARQFCNPWLQRLYYAQHLPMGLLAGIRLRQLNEAACHTTVPFWYLTKNPFGSMYFAVQSMAAELSTAAPAMLALKGIEADVALIIVRNAATFSKKAKTKITFTCSAYPDFAHGLATLKMPGDSVEVTATTTGTDHLGETVAVFEFTWAFRRKS